MKLATIRNGDVISMAQNLPRRAKLKISVWLKLPNEVAPRRTDMTPDGYFNVRAFLGDAENLKQYIDVFMDSQGIKEGDMCESYGVDVYRLR